MCWPGPVPTSRREVEEAHTASIGSLITGYHMTGLAGHGFKIAKANLGFALNQRLAWLSFPSG